MNKATPDRTAKAQDFLSQTEWADAAHIPLTGDASSRRYTRLIKNDQSALLMDVPQDAEPPACPHNASPAERIALGYNASARLAGARMAPFIAVARALHEAGLTAPDIYAVDTLDGFAVLEDLGDDLYARLTPPHQSSHSEVALYENAVNVLVQITNDPLKPANTQDYQFLEYDDTAMLAETALLTQWYLPHKTGNETAQSLCDDFDAAWRNVLALLSPPRTMVLRDYHAENLLWIPQRTGLAKTGLIDFQDALWGHAGYDLVSLLEDARRDVDPALGAKMVDHFANGLGLTSHARDAFDRDYAILGAQRNAKILGIFARLANRDGKRRYLDLLPRVENHFRTNLRHPVMANLRDLVRAHLPDLVTGEPS